MAAQDHWLVLDGIKGENNGIFDRPGTSRLISSSARLRLRRTGISSIGISQLAAGVPISNAKDRRIVERVVARALRPD